MIRALKARLPNSIRQILRTTWELGNRLEVSLRAFSNFLEEYWYYALPTRNSYCRKQLAVQNIRKLTHTVERSLFHPGTLLRVELDEIRFQLRKLLESHGACLDEELQGWVFKVLKESETEEACPLLQSRSHRILVPDSLHPQALMNLIRKRRSRRFFLPRQVDDDLLELLVESALHAPSTCNRQPLEFLIVQTLERKQFLSEMIPGGRLFFSKAPSIIVLMANAKGYRYPDDRVNVFSEAGSAIQNMSLMAESLGLGCCWGSFTTFGNIKNAGILRAFFDIPSDMLFLGALAVGWSEQVVCPIPRDKPRQRIFKEKWGCPS